ncbi:hypothetical protein ACIRSU_12425 [Streptomyces sp. NPDC101160]|uniref:hypothetical protein n=1 Tax=Streptomyces sp. NPDC101160 TaxID=3366118 RepID=UPI003815F129
MSMGEAPATPADAVQELREIAHSWVDGQQGEAGLLTEAALRALCAGLDTPSLLHLAALSPCEHDLAPELFGRVMDELGFGFHPPEEYWAGRLALARWWASEIVGGWLGPAEGIALIFYNVAEAYGRCEELNPVIDAVAAHWENGGPQRSPEEITAQLHQLARELLARIPAPGRPA